MRSKHTKCYYCGDGLDEDDTYRDPDGDPCCEECFHDRCAQCYECGETMWQSDAVYNHSNEEYYCDRCAARQDVYSCNACGDYYSLDDLTTTADDQLVCESCLSRHYTCCDACNEYHPNRDMEQVDGYDYCPNCIDDETDTCADCGDRIRNRNSDDWDGDTVCTTCFDQRKEKELAAESGD